MEKKDIFTQINDIESQMGVLHQDLGALKLIVKQLLEENQRLSIENQQLRKILKRESMPESERLAESAEQTEAKLSKTNAVVGEGYDNLARLYHEGFHICNVYYGHLRTEGDCLFCLSFLNK
ncbi:MULTISPECIES: DNA replication initiation control protein YabA [unclassified Paenibacillus]|uniref:DNA replication initiation control protein YabA n=1 Tax=unclassified Paenibacillus TaxID=185978 RepID=UPI001C104AF3|nr:MULTISPECIES: DNA replication initiation control protein YabA [unclassified Paenibacillus]MBU5444154.1 DNA replication initiation control protein YabA [Paenibacillus sp. MSJ-34]CAH0121972.1 Initiation-control protein YabA [Paenibacillus sp. CECT 9249]